MKILVLGGTGAMGMHLVHLLVENGHETFVTSRSKRKNDGEIQYIQGDARNIVFLQTVLHEHWDAIVDFMVYSTSDFRERVNLLLNATLQYIFLSSARAYANSDQPITENSPRLLDVSEDRKFLTTDEYALSKARQEDVLINSGKKNWTIIRPYITYSENRLQLGVLEKEEWLYRALNGRTIILSEEISSNITTLTYGLDVSKGIMAIIGIPNALGEAFQITTNEYTTWDKVLSIYLDVLEKHLGYKPKILLKKLDQFIEYHPAEYQIVYDRFFNRKFDNSKISQYIDVNNFNSIDTGLRSSLEEFLKTKKFIGINWQFEARKDKATKERTSLIEIQGLKQKIQYVIYRYISI